MGKNVTLVTDEANQMMLGKALQEFGYDKQVPMFVFSNPCENDDPNVETHASMQLAKHIIDSRNIDHIVYQFAYNCLYILDCN